MLLRLTAFLLLTAPVSAAVFSIIDYGATGNDQSDDTAAILKTLAACREAGGGIVHIPKGTYLISRQGAESPILEIPSHTILRGEGGGSTLKFDPKVNQSNFWRMLGVSQHDCRNVLIHNLRLDGSNTYQKYEPGKTPEQNHGIFLYRPKGIIENVTIKDCLIENFSGDCIGLGPGCRNITVKGCHGAELCPSGNPDGGRCQCP